MSSVFGILRVSFEWGLYLILIGGLGEATLGFYKEAYDARSHGLVSLSSLNRTLGMKADHESVSSR